MAGGEDGELPGGGPIVVFGNLETLVQHPKIKIFPTSLDKGERIREG